MRKVLRLTLGLTALALLNGCGKNIAAIVDTSLVCPSWKEITVSKGDVLTEKTAARIEGNNEARLEAGCPPDPERVDKKKAPAKKKPEAVTS